MILLLHNVLRKLTKWYVKIQNQFHESNLEKFIKNYRWKNMNQTSFLEKPNGYKE